MSLSVEDILSDLTKLQQSQSSSSATTHPILSLGNSLLPPNLQSEKRIDGSKKHQQTISESDPTFEASKSLEQALSYTDQSQGDALYLSSIYLESTRRVLALNQDRGRQESLDSRQEETGGLFDDLHRRVAKLQSSNESFRNKLHEVRQVIVTTEGQTGNSK